jgi:hypothetical protein
MSDTVKVALPNALILISDAAGGDPPDNMRGALVAATPSCIAAGGMSDANGKTEVTLGRADELPLHHGAAFDGQLETPSHAIAVWTVARQTILRAPVDHARTRVRIWVNHPSEPDKVMIGLG